MKKNIISEIISFLLILLFMYAALSKLLNYNEFKGQLRRSPLVSEYANPVAIVLPVTELITASILTVRQFRKTGFIISFILMIVFTAYILYMLLFARHLPCSCGGVLKQMTWQQHLVFNIFFTGLSLAGIITEHEKDIVG